MTGFVQFLHQSILIRSAITMGAGGYMPGRGDVATAREYERRIRNLLGYTSPETKDMAQKLLQEAGRNRKVSIRQFKHLEELFGSEKPPGWFRNTGNG